MMKMMMMNPAKKILPSVVKASNYTTTAAASSCTDRLLRPPPPADADLCKQPQSMGDPCLDLYFGVQVQPEPATQTRTRTRTPYKYLNQVLPLAWSHNPLTTLKLICNLRDDSNDLGKSDEKAFYSAALWLHLNHPKTLACNAASIAGEFTESVGTMDDLVQILDLLARGQDYSITSSSSSSSSSARDRYERDLDYRFLHDRFSHLFADHLRSDMRNLKQQPPIHYTDISSAALYCPPIGSSLDRSTLLCESIARILFPREESCPEEEYQGLDYAHRLGGRLRKEVLVPLTNFLLSESSSHRGLCPVKKYLEELKGALGQPIEPGALLPHDITRYVDDEDVGQAAELQWRRMVEDIYLKQGNKLNNCLAVCNVSSTVAELYKNVSVALSVLLSQLSEEPWKGKVINFSPNPQLHNLPAPQGNDLKSKCAFVRRMPCTLEIDLRKVFDLILQVAVDGNLRPDQMIKKVLVLTDLQTIHLAESDYESIKNRFKEKGYEDAVPQIVYWKLQSWGTPAAPCRRPGMATLDGFSDNLFKSFLDSNGEVGPYHVMEAAISGKAYQNLAVCD